MISHPFMSPTQLRDPPRYSPVVHDETFVELDPPQQSIVATATTKPHVDEPADVDQPRHVLE